MLYDFVEEYKFQILAMEAMPDHIPVSYTHLTNKLGDSLIVTGTTGEASLLTFDERVKLMETAINAAAGRMPRCV